MKQITEITKEQEEALAKAWREVWDEGFTRGYEQGCDDATDWEWGSNSKTSYRKEAEREEAWDASEAKARLSDELELQGYSENE